MILIFDYFETLLNTRSMDFNRGLKVLWEKYYSDKCTFDEIRVFGEEQFDHMLEYHAEGKEFPFVDEELPLYAEKFGGEVVTLSTDEEADFLMLCNEFEVNPVMDSFLRECSEKGVAMYVLSNSGFRGEALMTILRRFGIGKYFKQLWSSAEFGRIKPCKEFFELAINTALADNPEEKKEDIVFIGDMYETDVKGAYNAGIKAAWLNHKGEEDTENMVTYNITEMGMLKGVYNELQNYFRNV